MYLFIKSFLANFKVYFNISVKSILINITNDLAPPLVSILINPKIEYYIILYSAKLEG